MVAFQERPEESPLAIFRQKPLQGPLGLVNDGDEIIIDLPNRTLNLQVSDEELAQRAQERPKFRSKVKGWLARYTALVTSANTGGIMRVPDEEE